jgi:hypothetical protein
MRVALITLFLSVAFGRLSNGSNGASGNGSLFKCRINFEDDSYENFLEATGNAKVNFTTDPHEVIEGKRSLVIDTTATKHDWHVALKSKPGVLKPGRRYMITLRCRVEALSDSNDEFYLGIEPMTPETWVPFSTEKQLGVTKEEALPFIYEGSNDRRLIIGIRKQGRAVIDSVDIEEQNRLTPAMLSAPGEKVASPLPYEPYGLCIHADRISSTPFGYTDELVKRALDMWKEMGVQWVRLSLGNLFHDRQSAVSGHCDPKQQARLEMLINGLRERGIHFYIIDSDGKVPWYSPPKETVKPPYEPWAYPCPDSEEYRLYIEAEAKLYAKASDYWEIGNEMDWEFWAATPELYMKNLAIARAVLKKYNPNIRIIMGGLAGDGISARLEGKDNFLQRLYDSGLKGQTDILAFHLYNSTVEKNIYQLNRSVSVMTKNGDGTKPIWITETSTAMCVPTPDWKWVVTDAAEKAQSDYLRDTYTILLRHPNVEKVFWWNFKALHAGMDREAGLALTGTDLSPRPAYWEFKALPKQTEHFVNQDLLRIDGLGR